MKWLRITQDNDDAVREFCEAIPSLVCKEGPDNEKHCRKIHYHLLMDTDLTDNGLRKQIYKYFQISDEDRGQKTCAFTTITDIEGVKRYVCKGLQNVHPEITINTMEIDIDIYYNAFWDIFASTKERGAKERAEKKTRTQEFMDYFDTHYSGEDTAKYRRSLGTQHICSLMCEWFKRNGYKLPTKWAGQQLVMTCYNLYTAQPQRERVLLDYYGFGEYSDFKS